MKSPDRKKELLFLGLILILWTRMCTRHANYSFNSTFPSNPHHPPPPLSLSAGPICFICRVQWQQKSIPEVAVVLIYWTRVPTIAQRLTICFVAITRGSIVFPHYFDLYFSSLVLLNAPSIMLGYIGFLSPTLSLLMDKIMYTMCRLTPTLTSGYYVGQEEFIFEGICRMRVIVFFLSGTTWPEWRE